MGMVQEVQEKVLIDIPQVRTQTYGHYSIKSRCASTWNTLQNVLDKDLMQIAYSEAKKCIVQHCLDSYNICKRSKVTILHNNNIYK